MNSSLKFLPLALLGLLTVLTTGCSSVSVQNLNHHADSGVPLEKPTAIYVLPFDTNGEFNVDRTGADLADFKAHLQQMMSAALTTRFPTYLAPSRAITSLPAAGNYWVVAGEFIRVNQGSRALRVGIGFGAGGTKMETRVFVYDMASGGNPPAPFLTFETTGGSGAEPGLVAAMDPVSLAVSAVSGSAKGVTDDTLRTSRMITASLSDYMYLRGWVSKEMRLQPKMKSQ